MSIIDIFERAFFAFRFGIDDGGNNTISLPFAFATNSSITTSSFLALEKLLNKYSSVLVEGGTFNFCNLLAEPRIM